MLPPPAIRGIFRTDRRARAAYAEGAGIFRILPAAVCVPADREDVASVLHWAADSIAFRSCLAAPGVRWAGETWATGSSST